MNISIEEQITEVKREISMRHRVYSRQVSAGVIAPEEYHRRIQVMEAVLRTLEMVKQVEDSQLKLPLGV